MVSIKALLLICLWSFVGGFTGTYLAFTLAHKHEAAQQHPVTLIVVPKASKEPAATDKENPPEVALPPQATKSPKQPVTKPVAAKKHLVVLLVNSKDMTYYHNYHSSWRSIASQNKSCVADLAALQSKIAAHPDLYPSVRAQDLHCVTVTSSRVT
jgi:vancomycin resistance protein YoaR